MNRLKPERQKLVLNLLCEGNSIRSIVRLTGVNLRTIIRLVRECGELCEEELDLRMRNLNCKLLQADELHTICGKKERHVEPKDKGGEFGEMYLFIVLDPVSKIIPCFRVGKRTGDNAYYLIHDLKQRINGRFQLTTDGFFGYDNCMTLDFMRRVDYAQVIKVFKSRKSGSRETYSPSRYVWLRKSIMCGNPDPKHISTSLIENVNLQIRHGMRRFTRLTIAFSKKYDCLKASTAIYLYHYNFRRLHGSLRMTPAMAAGITDTFLTWDDVLPR